MTGAVNVNREAVESGVLPFAATCRRFGGVVVVEREWVDDEDGRYLQLRVIVPREREWRTIEAGDAIYLGSATRGAGTAVGNVVRDIGREHAEGKIPPATGPFFQR